MKDKAASSLTVISNATGTLTQPSIVAVSVIVAVPVFAVVVRPEITGLEGVPVIVGGATKIPLASAVIVIVKTVLSGSAGAANKKMSSTVLDGQTVRLFISATTGSGLISMMAVVGIDAQFCIIALVVISSVKVNSSAMNPDSSPATVAAGMVNTPVVAAGVIPSMIA